MPFYTNKGYNLNITVHPKCDLTLAGTWNFITNLNELHQELNQHIANAQRQYQGSADSRHLPAPDFNIGSQAFVKAQFFCTTQCTFD